MSSRLFDLHLGISKYTKDTTANRFFWTVFERLSGGRLTRVQSDYESLGQVVCC